MRFLVVFIDMLRPDLCRTFEPLSQAGPIDDFFERMGGTFFRRAYTPAPITSRSLACFWSGLYPAATGCTRSKRWPRDFMASDLPNLFSTFDEAGYSIHGFLNRNEKVYGLLPSDWQRRIHLNDSYDLETFLLSVPKRDKQLVFVSLIDVHWFMTDHGYTQENFQASQAIPVRALEKASRVHPFDEFDVMTVFSDHGFQEGRWQDCPWQERLARAKTGIALAWRNKGSRGAVFDDKLRSIMDVFPTLLGSAGLPVTPVDGIDLFDRDGHPHVIHEDALDISAHGPRSEVDLWGMTVADGYVAMTDSGVHIASTAEQQLLERFGPIPYLLRTRALIGRKSPTMRELTRTFEVMDGWEAQKAWFMNNGGYPDPIFADGTPVERWQSLLEMSGRRVS